MFDQMDFYMAMHDNYKGLAAFMQACQIKGTIKPLPHEGGEKLVYENRFGPFAKVPVPRYIPYETYKEQLEAESSREGAFDLAMTEAKTLMTQASQRIGKLAETDEEFRNTLHYPTAMLQQLQRLIVRNSLAAAKLKMLSAAQPDQTLVLTVDRQNSMEVCPAFDISVKAKKA